MEDSGGYPDFGGRIDRIVNFSKTTLPDYESKANYIEAMLARARRNRWAFPDEMPIAEAARKLHEDNVLVGTEDEIVRVLISEHKRARLRSMGGAWKPPSVDEIEAIRAEPDPETVTGATVLNHYVTSLEILRKNLDIALKEGRVLKREQARTQQQPAEPRQKRPSILATEKPRPTVEWQWNTALLARLFDYLSQSGAIPAFDPNDEDGKIWAAVDGVFSKDGKPITGEQLKQAKYKYSNNYLDADEHGGKPRGHGKIESVVNRLRG